MKFTAETTMLIEPYGCGQTEVTLVVTAEYHKGYAETRIDPAEPASVEILRVEVRDPKTRTIHPLPDYLAGVITDNDETHSWLLEEWARRDEEAREYAAEARSERWAS